jgi:hypothetical protein
VSGLTESDRRRIDEARELAGLNGADLSEFACQDEPAAAYAAALGIAQERLRWLADLAERLAAATGDDARRLGRIRDLLAHFDWEYHDRQLALEEIERIVTGGAR